MKSKAHYWRVHDILISEQKKFVRIVLSGYTHLSREIDVIKSIFLTFDNISISHFLLLLDVSRVRVIDPVLESISWVGVLKSYTTKIKMERGR